MKIYLAGNFPQLSKVEHEQKMVNAVHAYGSDYNRLITFFYPKCCATVVEIARSAHDREDARYKIVEDIHPDEDFLCLGMDCSNKATHFVDDWEGEDHCPICRTCNELS